MKIEVYEQRILIPEPNHWLYNEKVNIISDDKVYLGKQADESDWIEITEEQKQEIENKLNEEMGVE